MSKVPILDGMMKYINKKNSLFCMPGHKGGKGFLATEKGRWLYENIVKIDLTEVDGLDNFHAPHGIIKEAQEKLRDLYESKKSYFLVNGSTSGNLIMIFSCFNEGDKVIVERNCHRSIFNGIVLRKLNPVYIRNYFNDDMNAPLSIDEEYFLRIIKENKDAKGIIITYPNYYGVCCDLKNIINEARKYNMKVLVDSAHGAHFGISDKLPQSAVKLGADMVVMSSHKTLPSLTQTAYLHLCTDRIDVSKVDFYTSAFLSTSPSYIFMSSMDYARYYLDENGKKDYDNLADLCTEYSKKISNIKGLHVLNANDLNVNGKALDFDVTRLVVNVSEGLSGFKLDEYLRKNHIQPEMCDERNVVLICSPFNGETELKNLYDVLRRCNIVKLRDNEKEVVISSIPESKLNPYETLNASCKKVKLEDSRGKVSKSAVVPYPPGVPIIMPGEVFNLDVIKDIKKCIENNVEVLGIQNHGKDIIVDVICKD